MIQHIWTLAAQRTVVDRASNSLSIQEVLESIQIAIPGKEFKAEALGVAPIPFQVVSFFGRDKNISRVEQFDTKLHITDPNGKKIGEHQQNNSFPAKTKRLRTLINFNGFPITTAGDYHIELYIKTDENEDFQLVAKVPIEVEIRIA